jgi:hypothetical protein
MHEAALRATLFARRAATLAREAAHRVLGYSSWRYQVFQEQHHVLVPYEHCEPL